MNERKTLKSGAALHLQLSSFAVASRLRKAVLTELKVVNLSEVVKLAGGTSPQALLEKGDLPVETLKNLVCQMLASDAVEAAVAECMKVCQYKGEKIGPDTFEGEDTRADYLPVAWEVMVLNLAPFFRGLDLKSLIGGGTPTPSSPG